jgi:maltodextrin utilization protein YvdJ
LESTIQIFSKLIKPNAGYFIHADWTDVIPPSTSSASTLLLTTLLPELLLPTNDQTATSMTTASNNNDNITNATVASDTNQNHNSIHPNQDDAGSSHHQNGIMNHTKARQLYATMTNTGWEMVSIESVVFQNVYHHQYHHSNESNDSADGGSCRHPGSNVLIGIARRR